MAIPFRDRSDVEDLGLAGYLRFVAEDGDRGLRAALFLVNGRGEPIDFCFTRVDIVASFLWRAGEARRHAVRTLCVALFTACPRDPALLVARSDEVPPLTFGEDLLLGLPAARVMDGSESTPVQAATETGELLGDVLHVFWAGDPPPVESPARRLLEALDERVGVVEPFARAAAGLQEAFASL